MEEILYSRRRDSYYAQEGVWMLIVCALLLAATTYCTIAYCVAAGIGWRILWVLLGYGVYSVITVQLIRDTVRITRWARDEIVMTENTLSVMRGEQTVSEMRWQDIREIGVVPECSGGSNYSRLETVYFSTKKLDKPLYLPLTSWEKYVDDPDVIFFSSDYFGYLKPLLPQFEPWVQCITDFRKLGRIRSESSASAVYMQQRSAEPGDPEERSYVCMSCAFYEKLWEKERNARIFMNLRLIVDFIVSLLGLAIIWVMLWNLKEWGVR